MKIGLEKINFAWAIVPIFPHLKGMSELFERQDKINRLRFEIQNKVGKEQEEKLYDEYKKEGICSCYSTQGHIYFRLLEHREKLIQEQI